MEKGNWEVVVVCEEQGACLLPDRVCCDFSLWQHVRHRSASGAAHVDSHSLLHRLHLLGKLRVRHISAGQHRGDTVNLSLVKDTIRLL